MKLHKYLAIGIAMLAFTACSDDDDVVYNTNGNVSVEMQDPVFDIEENAGIVNIPIAVKGNANGMVRVDIDIATSGEGAAQEDKHFIVTGKTIYIPAGQQEGYVEVSIVDDRFRNPDHSFNVTIASAEGATIGAVRSTMVTIEDNDDTLYGRIQGRWRLNGIDGFTDSPIKQRFCTISGLPQGQEGYGEILTVTFTDDDDCVLTTTAKLISIDGDNALQFTAPQNVGNYAQYDLVFYLTNGSGFAEGSLYALINEDESRIDWIEGQYGFAAIACLGGQPIVFWDVYWSLNWDRD